VYDDFDTVRYSIESNNDISFYRDSIGSNGFVFANPSPWMTLPFGSKQTNVHLFTAYDTVMYNGQKITLIITGTADYVGTDKITKSDGSTFASGNQVKLTILVNGTAGGIVPITISGTEIYSFDNS